MSGVHPGILLTAPALAFGVSALLTLAFVRWPRFLTGMLDEPGERSLHAYPVPRTGGIAVMAGLVCGSAFLLRDLPEAAWINGGVLLVAVVSFLDDRGEVKPLVRLSTHVTAALALVAGGLIWAPLELPGVAWVAPPAVAVALSVLYVVWMINLYNFMDGMDGFAAGMTVFGFTALAVLGWQAGDALFAGLSGLVAAAAGGFLLGNFPPARIFLGDLGSATLGLLAAALSLLGARRGLFPLWVAWIAFSPFIADATWTLVRRLIRREPVWRPHRSHHYQRLVLAGWTHRETVLRAYLLMAACAASAVASQHMVAREQWLLLAAWAVIYLLIHYRTRLAERGGGGMAAP
jgi:UDP-N-acetylmuramyl pentapeptide phosphotransferase/UDP-N-acetylglucosamine-1-phosphate transferase